MSYDKEGEEESLIKYNGRGHPGLFRCRMSSKNRQDSDDMLIARAHSANKYKSDTKTFQNIKFEADNLRSRSGRGSKATDHEVEVVTISDSDSDDMIGNEDGFKFKSCEDSNSSANDYDDLVIKSMARPCLPGRVGERALFKPTFVVNQGKLEVIERIGVGAFGNVYKIKDVKSNKLRALKVIRTDKMTDPLESVYVNREIEVLNFINSQNPPEPVKKVIVKLLCTFTLSNHLCIMYELLGPTLHTVLKIASFKRYKIREIREISYQICIAVNFLHSLELIHHDIKPDNIVFSSPNYEFGSGMDLNVKLIDFGGTLNYTSRVGKTVTTMRYRSPETSLKGKSSYASDVWSLGATMFEAYTGFPLFNCKHEEEKFYMIEAIFCDTIPQMLAASSKFKCFNPYGLLMYDEKAKEIHRKVKPFNEYNDTPSSSPSSSETKTFFDLLTKMLAIRTCHRIDSYDVLRHNFFLPDSHSRLYEPVVPATARNLQQLIQGNTTRKISKIKSNIKI